MITISSYWNSNPGLLITSYMKNIYIKVNSDNHYTIRANNPPGAKIFLRKNIQTYYAARCVIRTRALSYQILRLAP